MCCADFMQPPCVWCQPGVTFSNQVCACKTTGAAAEHTLAGVSLNKPTREERFRLQHTTCAITHTMCARRQTLATRAPQLCFLPWR